MQALRQVPDRGAGDVYAELWPDVVRLAHLMTGSTAAGEDIAQDAFLGWLARAPDVENPRAYLRRSVVNLVINARRKADRERGYRLTLVERAAPAHEVDEMWPLIARLPARQRAVLVLRYYEDLSEQQIADVLGCRPGTVKSLSARALARLKKELSHD